VLVFSKFDMYVRQIFGVRPTGQSEKYYKIFSKTYKLLINFKLVFKQ